MTTPEIFAAMPASYKAGKVTSPSVLYFSVGDYKYTVHIDKDRCTVEPGKTTDKADVVLKTTPELFERMVVRGELPGTFDIMRGRVKTNDPLALKRLREYFEFEGR